MSARTDLFDYLEDAYASDAVRVVPAPDGTDPEPTLDLVVVGLDAVEPGMVIGRMRAYGLVVILVSRLTTPGTADDALEDALETLLDHLDAYGFAEWTKAERGTYRDAYPCVTVSLTAQA